jgi:hypothetical protein
MVFVSPHTDLWLAPRYSIWVGAIGSIALAMVIEEVARRGAGAAGPLRAAGLLGAALSLPAMAGAVWPVMNLAPVARDRPEVRRLTELRYLKDTAWDLVPMASVWGPLDAITRGGAGLSVYQAGDKSVFWTAPSFGSELQNRIWNFESSPAREPDTYFYHSPRGRPLYIGRRIERSAVATDPRYRLVAGEPGGETALYLSRSALGEHDRARRLADYYRKTSPEIVEATSRSAAAIEPGGLVLAPFPFAAGLLVHEADGRLRGDLQPVLQQDIEGIARSAGQGRVLYTFGAPIEGYEARVVEELVVGNGSVPLIRNSWAPLAR